MKIFQCLHRNQSCNIDSLKIQRIYYRGEGLVKESILDGKGYLSHITQSETIIEQKGLLKNLL